MQQDVLPSTKRVVDLAKFVKINHRAIDRFCKAIKEEDLKISQIRIYSRKWTAEQLVNLITLFNCINFSFWAAKGEEKWAVKINGEILDGAIALFRLLEKNLYSGAPLFEAKFLAGLIRRQLSELLKGNVEIPMLNERLHCLNETGEILLKKFQGSFVNILKRANKSAVRYANLLVSNFPFFNDFAVLDGIKVEFHKRAQLDAKMIADALENKGLGEFKDLDKLTVFADYKIPQILRRLKILEYSKDLAEKVDNLREIPPGSREEVEIRASFIWAAEEIKGKLKPKFPWVTSALLDSYFWLVGQKKSPKDKPYHRTRTIYY